MNATELRRRIIERVGKIDDESVLAGILDVLDAESNYKLSDQERAAVEEGLADIGEGRSYTSKDADALVRKWQKK